MEPSVELVVPVKRALAIGELLEEAAKALPALEKDGVLVGVKLVDSEVAVYGMVTVKNITGTVVGTFASTGEKTVTGQIRWNF
jgi:hypothetical protein